MMPGWWRDSVRAGAPAPGGGMPSSGSFIREAAAVRQQFGAIDLRDLLRSSPAKVIAAGLTLLLLCGITGIVIATSIDNRRHGLQDMLDSTEPDANSAQHLYSALSVADAAAGTAFIAGGLEPRETRDRYNQSIGQAAVELVVQSNTTLDAGTEDPDAQLLLGIATALPVYTGLVETARTANREGHPVGAAYLSEASNLMQSTLLPMAQQLQEHRAEAIAAAQQRQVRILWAPIALPVLTLVALIGAQVYLARRTRRILNPGLLPAAITVVILLAWTVAAGTISARSAAAARDNGAVPTETLTVSHTLAQQARSAETLKLLRRDASGDYDRTFDETTSRLTTLLSGYPRHAPAQEEVGSARSHVQDWLEAHQRMTDALSRGDFPGASAVAIGPGPDEAAAEVDGLDRDLTTGIAHTRHELRAGIAGAARALNLLSAGAVALTTLAAALVSAGLWPRLREYR
ncbi:hypothetical protein [Nocardia sp. alder85J]|uniref:hypothetical protein n=1 Tax=Nocardia sp. alder85J TaxID=2862949 RepID=UPI001CD50D2C|nr:hypothetical protein [Nocardia sp. alder85J]MCX4098952.1 hypothetical protein [Nocardia sp. alder85J]